MRNQSFSRNYELMKVLLDTCARCEEAWAAHHGSKAPCHYPYCRVYLILHYIKSAQTARQRAQRLQQVVGVTPPLRRYAHQLRHLDYQRIATRFRNWIKLMLG